MIKVNPSMARNALRSSVKHWIHSRPDPESGVGVIYKGYIRYKAKGSEWGVDSPISC